MASRFIPTACDSLGGDQKYDGRQWNRNQASGRSVDHVMMREIGLGLVLSLGVTVRQAQALAAPDILPSLARPFGLGRTPQLRRMPVGSSRP